MSKVHRGKPVNTPGFNALYRSILTIDSVKYHQDKKLQLTFRNLGLVPLAWKKRKSGISLYNSCGNPCENRGLSLRELNRKEIRSQLIYQQDSILNIEQLERFREIYEAATKRAALILKTYSIPPNDNSVILTNWKEAKAYYSTEIKLAFDPLLKQSDSELIKNRLQREKDLALRSIKRETENAARKLKTFKKFVKKGKGSARFFTGTTWHLDFGDKVENPEFHAFLKNDDFAIIQFDTLPTLRAEKLVQIDSFNCVPVHRYLYYKQLPGFDFKRSRYQNNYQPGSSVQAFREFTLYFEHNKSEYDRQDVEPIINFLQDSSYVIQQAKVHGFASVEGDSLNNQRLQEERARILIDLLQQEQTEDSIELVEITTAENWDMFFKQIKKSPFEDWEQKAKEEIKMLLENDSIALLLEPILAPERFATLKLRLRIKLDSKQKSEYSLREFQRAINRSFSSRTPEVRRQNIIKAAQIRSYVRDAYREGTFDGDPCEFFETNHTDLDILHFYEMRDDLSRGLEPVCENVEEITRKAHYSLIYKLSSVSNEQYPGVLRQAIDVQNFIFEGLLNKTLPSSYFNLLEYPKSKRYHYLILNSYYFRNFTAYDLMKEYNLVFPSQEARERKPARNTFYYILKEIVLNDEFEMIRRTPGYFEFELYDFLSFYSVNPWDPSTMSFFDEEVDEKVMKEQLNRLMDINSIICDRIVYQLYLDYHLKAAYYNYLLLGPDNPYTTESLTHLYRYHYNRREELNPESTKSVALTLLWYARKSYNKDLLLYAYDLLESQYSRNQLDQEGGQLFEKVLSAFPDRVKHK